MKTFRVRAKYTTYLYMDVEAENDIDAYIVANNADGGEFREEPIDAQGDWVIYDVVEV